MTVEHKPTGLELSEDDRDARSRPWLVGTTLVVVALLGFLALLGVATGPGYNVEAENAARSEFATVVSKAPGVKQALWRDHVLTVVVDDDGTRWTPVADATCAAMRRSLVRGRVSVAYVERHAFANGRLVELARVACAAVD